jgi:hypothetical protein
MEADSLKDLVVRTETNGLVTDLVNLDHVRSMLRTISYRRRFLAQQQAQAAGSDQGTIHLLAFHAIVIQSSRPPFCLTDVPEIIVVEDAPTTPPPPASSRDIASAKRQSAGFSWVEPETPTRNDNFASSDLSPLGGGTGGSSVTSAWRGLRRDRRESDMSALSADLGLRHTYVPTTAD